MTTVRCTQVTPCTVLSRRNNELSSGLNIHFSLHCTLSDCKTRCFFILIINMYCLYMKWLTCSIGYMINILNLINVCLNTISTRKIMKSFVNALINYHRFLFNKSVLFPIGIRTSAI